MATKKSTRRDPLRGTAIHEAGHAVLQTALGIGCQGLTIVPDHDSAGHARHGGEGKQAQHPGDVDDDVANLRLFAEDAFQLRHAIAAYAGAEAERRVGPEHLQAIEAGAQSDYQDAATRITEITLDPESIDLLDKYAQRRCTFLVEHYWPEIQAVANALLEAGTLTGEQVQEVLVESVHKRDAALLRW
jgi:ATP-dependent Zn protease